MLSIGKRIKELRRLNSLTQPELALKLNVSRQVISNWERGYTPTIDADYIAKMAKIFNCSSEYLITGKKTPEDIINSSIHDDQDLSEFFDEITKREELKLLFKQVKPLKDDTIKRIIKYIKIVEDEEDKE